MSGLLPLYQWFLVLGEPERSTEEVSDWRLVGGHGGGKRFVRNFNLGVHDTGGTIFGKPGGGMESAMVEFLYFF